MYNAVAWVPQWLSHVQLPSSSWVWVPDGDLEEAVTRRRSRQAVVVGPCWAIWACRNPGRYKRRLSHIRKWKRWLRQLKGAWRTFKGRPRKIRR